MRRAVVIGGAIFLGLALSASGCYRSATKVEAPPPVRIPSASAETDTTAPPATIGAGGEGHAAAEKTAPSELPPAPQGPEEEPGGSSPSAVSGVPEGGARTETDSSGNRGKPATEPAVPAPAGEAGASRSAPSVLPAGAPVFARDREELVYRVEFLGLTMGYARFRFRGIVRIGEKEAYHLTVRAWTSDLLSVFFPMNDTIEYFLDVNTLAPIRQEFTNSQKEDDIASYDQQTGKIVYRYKNTGKIRKQVDAVPGVYDPVSIVYYFRTRELSGEETSRHMYAGRKLWEVSAKPVGTETIRTDRGQFDTVMIEPVLRRNGNLEHKGNLRVWMTRDERHVPVKLYAKFRKVRTWTLVGELLPDRQGG